MDLYIDREELIRGLSRVQGIVERRTTNLALAHVLLSAEGNSLRLTATDTMVSLVADYVARVERPGEISVDAQSIFQVARSLPESAVHLKAEAGNRLAIHSGKSEFHLVGMSAEDFPPLPSRDDRAALGIPGTTLHRLINETLYAVCVDDSRYGLNGAHLEEITSDGGEARLRMVTTDGSRLSFSETAYEGEFQMGRRMLLPRKALDEVRKLCEGDVGAWEIAFGERSATFQTQGLTLMVRLVDGEFPDYRQVLPEAYKRRLVLNRKIFQDALKRVAIVASDRNHSVRFSFEEQQLVLEAQNVDLGNAKEEVEAELEGDSFDTGFNISYFMDIMRNTSGDELILEMGEPLDPCIVRIPGRDDCLFVVMPIRLD
ncbi:MAG: DNA polymerase III subunit beta [Deltaproteobacteria bacterium]|nr:DNA polymerase III subunit beta [Deltaproteobacteria bacterium]